MNVCPSEPKTGPGYRSPLEAINGPQEMLLYVTCVQVNGKDNGKPDFLATIDVDPKSEHFCQIISRAEVSHSGDELHHFGWNSCSSCHCDPSKRRDKLVCPTLNGDRIYVFDTSRAQEPQLFKVIEREEMHGLDVSGGHTSHCLPSGEVMISCMGDRNRDKKASFLLLDAITFEVKGVWNCGDVRPEFNYDFWYQPRHNVMISSEWCAPNTFQSGFRIDDVVNHKYGHSLNVWDWNSRKLIQTIDLGSEGLMPLEIRFLHNPSAAEGFVGCALSSNVFRFYKSGAKWKADKVIDIESVEVTNWSLTQMPALITDILISLDDRYLFASLWLFGEIHQFDIKDTSKPILIAKCFLGGSLCTDSSVRVVANQKRSFEQKERTVIRNKKIKGGPQMLQLSLDGRRLYATTSLYSVWDKQFYPDMVEEGSVMVLVDVDNDNHKLSINQDFLVDFGNGSEQVLAHEIRYPGGDCTSDIWL